MGLGESVSLGAILDLGITGPLALLSVSSNTIEVLLRLRERLQSAVLQERGATVSAASAFGRLFIFGFRLRCGGAG